MKASLSDNTKERSFSLWSLAWPIFIELMLMIMLGTVDTLMVSRISDDAVAVTGLSNQLFGSVSTVFSVLTGGAGIIIAQKLGARLNEEARTVAIITMKVTGLIGILLGIVLYLFPEPIARIIQMPASLIPLSRDYLAIVGGGLAFNAMSSAFSTAIRSSGNTKGPMVTAVSINVLHVALNYAFIFGAFGFPEWGLTGVAVSNLLSRIVQFIILAIMFVGSFERRIGLRDLRIRDRKLFREILRIGWPLGVNSSCWSLSQMVIFMFLAMLGAKDLAARTYLSTLESYCFVLGYSIALSVQIQIAHQFGAKQFKQAYSSAYRALYIGLAIVLVNATILAVFGKHFLSFFTDDPEIQQIGIALLVLNMILQPGKMLNMGFNAALNGVGDTRYSMVTSIFSMWLIATGLSYVLGVHYGWGLTAIYCCMIADEYTRGILVFIRWKQRKYVRRAQGEDERLHGSDKPVSMPIEDQKGSLQF
ncbi:putative MATE family efflux protein [Paenibacillus cellulosilyticus]|uniref:Putative MATE family efflux protein n=1 Tax=Paenibacillus cellulosilyticus TaxID=375489 RepID=A0A2V2YSA7_9BACL|nr:MATE family efflux transporter [Paenibacillus cellulosilyticus]PWW00979.1 putative MATE family efflux protein [Paenibacillus cellulosilyticus]QKS47621.1 MATE family efflux transporter [Paenibacillus cellulosilyticus]